MKPVKNKIKNNMENELYQLQELRSQTIVTIRYQEEQVKELKKSYSEVSTRYNVACKTLDAGLKLKVYEEVKVISNNLFTARKRLQESKNRKSGVVTHLRILNASINQYFPYKKE